MNLKLAVIRVLQNFSFKPCKETQVRQLTFCVHSAVLGEFSYWGIYMHIYYECAHSLFGDLVYMPENLSGVICDL